MTTSSQDSASMIEAKPATPLIRCAALGVGRMGQHHARVYAEMDGVELVGVYDANPERAAEIAEKHGCPVLATIDDVIAAKPDAVSIAVPTIYHRETAEPLLKAGIACLIEKPLAQDPEEAAAIKAVADDAGAVLMVGHIERFNPIMRALQRATADGLDIIPRFIEVHRVSPMTFRSVDIGVVMDMGIHDLDVVIMLMGGREPDRVEATGVPIVTEHEDLCNARLTWEMPAERGGGTCVANMTFSRLALKTERVTRITAEDAYIKIDYGKKSGTLIRRTANEAQLGEMRERLRDGADLTNLKWDDLVNMDMLDVDDGEPIVMEIEAFLDAVRSGRRPDIDANAGLANVRTAQRIVEAIRDGLPTPQGV
ncbi:MAG: Gfo/Idh/MocA family oxidoreductase [Planctomycetota bacterium]